MQVKVKKLHPDAVIPSYSRIGDAGMDFVAMSANHSKEKCQITYGSGIAIEIPEGYVGLVFPRSSISKKDLVLSNSVGIIDSNYRGEIMFKFNYDPDTEVPNVYGEGDRIGQIIIIPYPDIELVEADELSSTERGTGAFGSSGNQRVI